MTRADLVNALARLVGIADGYHDLTGRWIATSGEAKEAVLAGLGLPVAGDADAAEALERIEARERQPLPPLLVIRSGRPATVTLRGLSEGAALWRIREEGGETHEGRAVLLPGPEGARMTVPALPAGYHRLRVSVGSERTESLLIAAPQRCHLPAEMADDARLWGTTAQIYALRSARNLGIGDYSDIGEVAAGTARLGASFLGLSPVHALFAADRSKISPYSPSSRLFLETLFIDPTTIHGFAESGARSILEEASEQIAALRSGALVDHEGVWALKRRLLDALWTQFQRAGDASAPAAFRRNGGDALEAHATFEALAEHFRHEGRLWAGEWPTAFRRPQSPEVHAFRDAHRERIAFHAWLQWIADRQLGEAAERARLSGMGIGLYRDLAVGADSAGSEVWAAAERFATGLSVGSPPDPFGPEGQNWGLPPFNPLTLVVKGLGAFRELVSANMRHAGAIRIDHAFQLQRLFVIPSGATAALGAYVGYPFEAMLAVLRIESQRARCLVIAEDLGTAPPGFSDAIIESGLLSYRVLWFEREHENRFKPPQAYPRSSLAALTTHDLPTFRGWWRALDVDLRQSLGLQSNDRADAERQARARDVDLFDEALAAEGIAGSPAPDREPSLDAAVRYLGRARSALVALQLEDVLGEVAQANLPGPDVGHPNWKRRLSADVDAIVAPGGDLAKLAAAFAAEGRGTQPHPGALAAPPPRATYRLQFNKDFTFNQGAAIAPYLARLGVSHVYASPIQTARPGSTHGYDIVDHGSINPELGGEEGFRRLTDTLKEHGLGLLLDVVPNHMGVGGADNAWWLSVLEWGRISPFECAFDIDWDRLGAQGKLIVPFLGKVYGEALEAGELKLAFDGNEGSFSVWHWEHRFPICPLTYPIILDRALAALQDQQAEGMGELIGISERLRAMNEEPNPERRTAQREECEGLKGQIAHLVSRSAELRQALDRAIALVSGVPGMSETFGTLHRILEAQAYRLAYWRVAASDINYRRFFDINSLAGLKVEDPEIFRQSHALIVRLVEEGRIQGLRIDHIDGLADPEGYVRSLQGMVGPGFYIVVEKILGAGEELRPWPVAGTTGYDALNLLDGVFVDTQAGDRIKALYQEITGVDGRPGGLLRQAKAEVLSLSFASELEVLVSDVKRLADSDRRTRDYTVFAIRQALTEIIARFPVYRTYLVDGDATAEDRALIEGTFEAAKRSSTLPDVTVHDFIAGALLSELTPDLSGSFDLDLIRRFRRRFQQLTGPVMAKSLEDTLFYRYVPLASLNEVGGDPMRFGVTVAEFHRENRERARRWPHALTATATHDTKRGEDNRLRLDALSEIPDEWRDALRRWEDLSSTAMRGDGPDANDRYFVLQSLLGAWPLELLGCDADAGAIAAFGERMEAYVLKALREAKRHTSWVRQNETYEAAAADLVRSLVSPGSAFLTEFRPLARRLAFLGMLSGLSRTLVKITMPGVPDLYQGTEAWDLSLVDPDNRRPVDYGQRARSLESGEPLARLLGSWQDGRIKQHLIVRLLADRAATPDLYAQGDYEPVAVKGPRAANIVAFARRCGEESLVVVAPRLFASMVADEQAPIGALWEGTVIALPEGSWRDVLTDRAVTAAGGRCDLGDVLSGLPVAALRRQS